MKSNLVLTLNVFPNNSHLTAALRGSFRTFLSPWSPPFRVPPLVAAFEFLSFLQKWHRNYSELFPLHKKRWCYQVCCSKNCHWFSAGNAPPQTASWNCSNGASLREMRNEASHTIGSFMHKHTGVVSLEPHEQFQLMGTKIAQAVGSVFHH